MLLNHADGAVNSDNVSKSKDHSLISCTSISTSGNVMVKGIPLIALILCTACLIKAPAQAAPDIKADTVVVRTQEQWNAVIASGQATPLDALTPHGKKAIVEMLSQAWGERGLIRLPIGYLVRELNKEELYAVLAFLGSEEYMPMAEGQLIGAPLRTPAPSALVERDFQQLKRALNVTDPREGVTNTTSSSASMELYSALFAQKMSTESLKRQPLGDLPLLFDAAADVDFRNPGSVALGHMRLVHQELTRRGVDTRRTLDETVRRALIAARKFEQAREFVAARPHLSSQAIPNIVDTLGPSFVGRSVFDYDRARNTLTRHALSAAGELELVLIVDDGCQPSRRVLDAIRTDPKFTKRLRQANLTLITPPSSPISFEFVSNWNSANPTIPIRIPYNHGEWKAVNARAVPMFYLLKNGRVVDKMAGWPQEGNKAELLKLLEGASSAPDRRVARK